MWIVEHFSLICGWLFVAFPVFLTLIILFGGYKLQRIKFSFKRLYIGVAIPPDRVGQSTLEVEKFILICPVPFICLVLRKIEDGTPTKIELEY